jgi:hypothetical protein
MYRGRLQYQHTGTGLAGGNGGTSSGITATDDQHIVFFTYLYHVSLLFFTVNTKLEA